MEAPAETYRDGDLTLTRWHPGDRTVLTAVVSGSLEHLGAWMIWATGGYTDDDSSEFLRLTGQRWDSGEAYEYALMLGAELAGSVGLMRRDGGVEIGYWLARGFVGRGLMTRAVTLLTEEAFRLGAGYVEIKHDELNVRSGAVPARLGFTKVRSEPAEKPLAPSCTGTNHVWRLARRPGSAPAAP
ncbi:GNAT family N-acetyltransferase [Amycolatopsis sp. A133]|uniref:GNAT family N-acetyltransferase n=1 Tax=Amycolatopsis sp. A133 TaxID=3064472 RepID=UPI0027FC5DEA|nr:GNAT family N-acetyltransferase [Amycolatopsis sp. A133]MDQ7803157.1 GNAT family N-acetyltransferase [Amycolatopsis sp. A133]